MRRTKTRKLRGVVALVVALMVPAPLALAGSGGSNEVTGLVFEETDNATLLTIEVAEEPTFSVFKLRNPSRLLVEVSDCKAPTARSVDIGNGVIDQASVSSQKSGQSDRCRVIVSLEGEATYDVSATAQSIVVAVGAENRTVRGDEDKSDSREVELQRAMAALEGAQRDLKTLQEAQSASQVSLDELKSQKAALESKIKSGESEALESSTKSAETNRKDLEALAKAKAELETLRGALTAEQDRAASLNSEVSSVSETVASLGGQLEALQAENVEAKQLISKLGGERDEAARRAEVAETRAKELSTEVDKLKKELTNSKEDDSVERMNVEIAQANTQRALLETELTKYQEQVANGNLEAEKNLAQAERMLKDATREVDSLQEKLEQFQTAMETKVTSLESDLVNKKAEMEDAQRKAKELKGKSDVKIQELSEALAAREAELKVKEAELAKLKEQESTLRAQMDANKSTEQEAKDSQVEMNELKRRQAKLQTELEAEVDTLQTALAEREAALQRSKDREDELQAKYETLKDDREKERVAVTSLIETKEGQLADAKQTEASLREELAALQTSVEMNNDPTGGAAFTEKQAELNSALKKQRRLEGEVDQLGKKLEQNNSEFAQLVEQSQQTELAAKAREDKFSEEITQLNEMAQNTKQKLVESAAREEALRAEVQLLKQQVAEGEAAKSELEVRTQETDRIQAELDAMRLQAEAAKKTEAEIEKLKKTLAEAESARKELKQLRVKVADTEKAEEEVARLRAQIEEADAAREELVKLKSKMVDSKAAEAEIARLKSDLEASQKSVAELNQLREQVKALETSKEKLENAQALAAQAPLDENVGGTVVSSKGAPLDNTTESAIEVRDIRFEKDGSLSRIIVETAGKADYHTSPWADGQAKLVLRAANLPDSLKRKLDTRAFKGPVNFISTFSENGDVTLVAEIDGAGSEVVRSNGSGLVWEFTQVEDSAFASNPSTVTDTSTFIDRRKRVRIAAAEPQLEASADLEQDDITVKFGKREKLDSTRLARRRITLDVRDADINDLLRLIADEVGVSIVTSPDVSGKVTLSLKSVPLDQALDIILRAQNLGMRQEGSIIWVAKIEVFQEEQRRALEAAIVRDKLEPLEVRLIPVNYATAADLQKNVDGLLSERGSVQIDARTNTLIIKDVGVNLNAAEILVESLDTQTPQILIEARIVETQSNYSKEMGVQWGGDFSFSPANGNPTGLVFPSSIGVAGGSTNDSNSGTTASPNFAVNLPAAVGTGSGGALGMTFGSVGGSVNLNLRLSALEEKGFVKIVSAPRVMTLDNVKASIEQGVSIPVSVVSAAGVQTVFFDAKLNLSVQPHVTKDGNIFLIIDVTKNEPDFSNTGAQGDPSIIRKEAHTQLLVPDGDTTVIGGIYTRNTAQGLNTVPFFGSIPIIGYFFRKTNETDNRTELLIFITPRIINRESSIGMSGPGTFIAPLSEEEAEQNK